MYSRSKVVDLVNSWKGKKVSDGSYKEIIDIYNANEPFPRGIKMEYQWPWCACTWSALAKKLGYTSIMPVEISCGYLIDRAKELGCWKENDDYIPRPGDAVLYDWDDNGRGDNTAWPDHVGTVTYCNPDSGYFVVMEGNHQKSVKERTVSLNGRYIRGFISPKYDDNTLSETQDVSGKSIDTVAHEVIAGKWGNGDERKRRLTAAGYDYEQIRSRVNEILNGSVPALKAQDQSQNQPVEKKVTATCSAKRFNKSYAGTYRTTANLHLRNDAGTNKKSLCLIPKGLKVQNYGYYNSSKGKTWLYIEVKLDGVLYTGFSHIDYLKRV